MQGLSPLHNGFTKAFAFVIVLAAPWRGAMPPAAWPARGAKRYTAGRRPAPLCGALRLHTQCGQPPDSRIEKCM